jgi:hypothetical protein
MIHYASTSYWTAFESLSINVSSIARKNFDLLKNNPRHPSLHLKKVGRYWSVRVGIGHRALAVEIDDGMLWFWIGSHAEYDRIITS